MSHVDQRSEYEDERDLRSKAMKRAWMCPGCGAALIGHGVLGGASFVGSLTIGLTLFWLALQPTVVSLTAVGLSFAVALLAWLAEVVAVRRSQIRPGTQGFLAGGLILPIIVMGLVVGGGIIFAFRSFGHSVMAGSGMSPTIEKGEHIHYSKRIDWDRVNRGSLIVFKNSRDSRWGEAGWIVVSRILAMPGDSISIEGDHYVVNGEKAGPIGATGKSDLAVDIPTAPHSMIVPEGCYFMVQDNRADSFDSRVLSWARKEDLLSARIWRFNREKFFQPVE